jgi:hypothetical protein
MLIQERRWMGLPVRGLNVPEVYGEVSVVGMCLNRDE